MFSQKVAAPYRTLRSITDDIDTIIFLDRHDNPLFSQGITFCGKPYHLVFFERSTSNLTYEFEKGITLKFYLREKLVILRIINPRLKIDESIVWPERYASIYTSLSWNNISKELDYINAFAYELNHMS